MHTEQKEIFSTSYETLKLLNYIINNETICRKDIQSCLGNKKSESSNFRHFKTIKFFFEKCLKVEVFEKSSRGCYKIINKDTLKQALNLGDRKELLSYIHILKEVLPHYYDALDESTKKSISHANKDASSAYLFHNNPMEDFKNNEILKIIEKSIIQKRRSSFQYKENTYKDIKPLKIIFMEGNLYLACLTNDDINNGFKFLRITYIDEYLVGTHDFNENKKVSEAQQFIEKFQTSFSHFNVDDIPVTIIATKKVAQHFLQKKHLPSQETRIMPDGSGRVELRFYVTNYKDIERLVKNWLPDLTIIEPPHWQKKLELQLKQYLDNS